MEKSKPVSDFMGRRAVARIVTNGASVEVEVLRVVVGIGGEVACASHVLPLDESGVVQVEGAVVALAKTLLHAVLVAPAGPVLVDGPVGVLEFELVAHVAVGAVEVGDVVVYSIGLFMDVSNMCEIAMHNHDQFAEWN